MDETVVVADLPPGRNEALGKDPDPHLPRDEPLLCFTVRGAGVIDEPADVAFPGSVEGVARVRAVLHARHLHHVVHHGSLTLVLLLKPLGGELHREDFADVLNDERTLWDVLDTSIKTRVR